MDNAALVPHCLLTALFTVTAVHALRQACRPASFGYRGRVDHFLHAAMGLAMAAMPWKHAGGLPVAVMTWFFLAAALWFPLTATGRRVGLAPAIAGRLPPAAGMAAMVWMLRKPHTGPETAHGESAGASLPAHHLTTTVPAAGPAGTGPAVTMMLVLFLLGYALWSLTRPMPAMRATTGSTHLAASAEPYRYVREGAMALGTAIMLLMPH